MTAQDSDRHLSVMPVTGFITIRFEQEEPVTIEANEEESLFSIMHRATTVRDGKLCPGKSSHGEWMFELYNPQTQTLYMVKASHRV